VYKVLRSFKDLEETEEQAEQLQKLSQRKFVPMDIEKIRQDLTKRSQREKEEEKLFSSRASDNIALGGESMRKMFERSEFRELEVVGQFNHGFILATLEGRHLFILDQHASDEKFNFEDLSRNTVINSQPLVAPIELELSVQEMLTLELHEETLSKNGFVVEQKEPESNVFLVKALPYSKQTQFSVDDLQDLLHRCSYHLEQK